MAPSPYSLKISTVDSTCRRFEGLDLMGSGSKNMDLMDIDQVIDVPDTPDRLDPRQKISLTVVDDTANGDSHSRGIVNRLRGSRRSNFNDRNTKELHSHPQRNLDTHDEAKHSSSSIVPGSDWASVSDGFYNSTMRLGGTIPRRHETIVATQTQHTEPVLSQSKRPLCVPSSSHSTDYLVDRTKVGHATSDVAENSCLDVKTEGGNRGKMIDLREKIPSGDIVPTKSRAARRKIFRGHRISNLEKHMWSENASQSFTRQSDTRVLDSDVEPDYSGMPKRAFSFGRSDEDAANGMGVGSILSGGSMREAQNKSQATGAFFRLHNVSNSSEAFGNFYKRETDGTSGAPGVRMNHESANSGLMGNHKGKGIDFCSTSPPKTAQSASISLPVTSPRKIGQRRLVRNGCISPYNIAKSKGASENCCKNATSCKQDENGKVACNNPSDGNSLHPIHIISSGSEVSQFDRAKGKGIMNGYIPENVYDSRSLSSRNSLIPREEDSAIGDDNGDIFRRADEIRGWQCTRNHLEKTSFSSSHHTGSNSKTNDGSCNSFEQSHGSGTGGRDYVTEPRTSSGVDLLEDGDLIILQHAGPVSHQVQASSRIISVSEIENRGQIGKQKLIKRPRKNTLTYNHHGECSSSTFDDSEVSLIGSSGQPSTTKPTRTRNSQRCNTLGPVIEVDGLCSPEARSTDHQDSGSMLDDGSTARQRQVEADEILALQLQEQLYSELPVGMEGAEVDAGLAWAMQHEEDAQRVTSVASWRSSLPRNPPTRLLHGRYPSQSVPSSSTQLENRARGPTSRRMQQLRRHFYGRSPTAPSRERSFQFPAHMDLDTRIDLLEAMEFAFGNMHGAAIADRFFQVQRDFNENDYELLLALDDDNRHAGASVDQINSLPQSTIQTGNFEEACAICLETPTIGEIIRHLPCLHKFHKECIDSWLRRKTSCPICKSSIA